jgi:hypothetical protein
MLHTLSQKPATLLRPSANDWIECTAATDRSGWGERVDRFFQYWLDRVPAPGLLPGRQHIDPLAMPDLISRLWLLDVVRPPEAHRPPRFRYRLVGTKEVETLQREVTGQWFDEVHANAGGKPAVIERLTQMVNRRMPTYRRGSVRLAHHKDHQRVENCMVPLASDGRTVDIIAVLSQLYWADGREA